MTDSGFNKSRPQNHVRRWLLPVVVVLGVIFASTIAMPRQGQATPQSLESVLTHAVRRGPMLVTVTEQGTLESSRNTEIKCKVRGQNTVIEVVESGTYVNPGDVLVRLDTLFIEEQIAERTKYALWSRSAAERSKADVARSDLAVKEYLEGRFVTQLKTLQKDKAIAEANLRSAKNMFTHANQMAKSRYVSDLEVEEKAFAVERAKLAVDVAQTQIEVLQNFTKAEQLETLNGNLLAVKATHEANVERAEADASRRDRAVEELGYCVVRADRAGMVIHPSAARWKNAPEIEEGATVHKDQVLLLMPDLDQMQVTVGVHESVVDRVTPGLKTRVSLPEKTIWGEVESVASITSPAGWWTGNVVKYETVIKLPQGEELMPGMSAEAEIILAEYQNEVTVPVAAVIETANGFFAWVLSNGMAQRRELQLGDSNDVSLIVKSGLSEGDQVILNPLAHVTEAQDEVLQQASPVSEDKQDTNPQSDSDTLAAKASLP